MADGGAEITRITIDECFVFKIPPRSTAAGYRAADWKEQVWSGRLELSSKKDMGAIKLVNSAGKVYAIAPIRPKGPSPVERVTDSSRYFALRVENREGKHAYIGLGFRQRSDAFSLNVALQEMQKEFSPTKVKIDYGEDVDLELKGPIKLAVPKTGGSASRRERRKKEGGGGGGFGLAPPPSKGEVASSKKKDSTTSSSAKTGGDLLGLGAEDDLFGASGGDKPTQGGDDDWEAF